jgi:hypothetical protein
MPNSLLAVTRKGTRPSLFFIRMVLTRSQSGLMKWRPSASKRKLPRNGDRVAIRSRKPPCVGISTNYTKGEYDQMSAQLATAVRRQFTQVQAIIKSLGSVTSPSFRTTGPGGADIYDVEFVNGHTQ